MDRALADLCQEDNGRSRPWSLGRLVVVGAFAVVLLAACQPRPDATPHFTCGRPDYLALLSVEQSSLLLHEYKEDLNGDYFSELITVSEQTPPTSAQAVEHRYSVDILACQQGQWLSVFRDDYWNSNSTWTVLEFGSLLGDDTMQLLVSHTGGNHVVNSFSVVAYDGHQAEVILKDGGAPATARVGDGVVMLDEGDVDWRYDWRGGSFTKSRDPLRLPQSWEAVPFLYWWTARQELSFDNPSPCPDLDWVGGDYVTCVESEVGDSVAFLRDPNRDQINYPGFVNYARYRFEGVDTEYALLASHDRADWFYALVPGEAAVGIGLIERATSPEEPLVLVRVRQ